MAFNPILGFYVIINMNLNFLHRFLTMMGICDALLCVSHALRVHWRVGRRLGLCRLTSAQALIRSTVRAFTICSVSIGGSVLFTMTQFLTQISNRSYHVIVVGCRSKLVTVVFLLTPWSFFPYWRLYVIGYADLHANGSTLVVVENFLTTLLNFHGLQNI